MSDQSELDEILEFGVSIAGNSGRIARRYFRSSLAVENKSEVRFDPVTEADRKIERYLRRKIRQKYPEHGLVGEEQGSEAGNEYTWIIDPVDGTRGFITGSPMWGTLLGFMDRESPLAGIMHQPFIRETFYADTRASWWCSGKKLRRLECRDTARISNAILYCTHPAMFEDAGDREAYSRVEADCRFSRYGADCYGYCLLAAGFADIVIEADLQPYDIIPLIPIVESAGGVVSNWNGGPAREGGRIVAAANPVLHEQALGLLNKPG